MAVRTILVVVTSSLQQRIFLSLNPFILQCSSIDNSATQIIYIIEFRRREVISALREGSREGGDISISPPSRFFIHLTPQKRRTIPHYLDLREISVSISTRILLAWGALRSCMPASLVRRDRAHRGTSCSPWQAPLSSPFPSPGS
jgi:hypothetical protein